MKLDYKKNVRKGIAWGIVNKISLLFFMYAIRTMTIYTIGADYVGLNSLFTSILSVLNSLELGMGSALLFFMYKPIANSDYNLLGAILKFYRKAYLIIGVVIFCVGVSLIPFLNYFIKGDYPSDINLKIIYMIYLINSALGYALFSYRNSLLIAYQRNDLISIVNIITNLLMYSCQIYALVVKENYYLYLAITTPFLILGNYASYRLCKKLYPMVEEKGSLSTELVADIRKRVYGTCISNLCNLSRFALGSIFVSAYIGLAETTIYSNYMWIINSVTSVFVIIYSVLQAGIGNKVMINNSKQNFEDLRKLLFLYIWFVGWCATCILFMIQPFSRLSWGESMVYPNTTMVWFVIYFYVLKIGDPLSLYSIANGMWWEKKWVSILETVLNVVFCFFLGSRYGAKGIVFSTVVSVLIIPVMLGAMIDFRYFFEISWIRQYFRDQIRYSVTTLATMAVTYLFIILWKGQGWGNLLYRAVICLFVPNLIYLLCYRDSKWVEELMVALKKRFAKVKGGVS